MAQLVVAQLVDLLFRHQRSAVRIQSEANFIFCRLYRKDKNKVKRPRTADLKPNGEKVLWNWSLVTPLHVEFMLKRRKKELMSRNRKREYEDLFVCHEWARHGGGGWNEWDKWDVDHLKIWCNWLLLHKICQSMLLLSVAALTKRGRMEEEKSFERGQQRKTQWGGRHSPVDLPATANLWTRVRIRTEDSFCFFS